MFGSFEARQRITRPAAAPWGRLREGLETGGRDAPNDGQVQQCISPVHHLMVVMRQRQ